MRLTLRLLPVLVCAALAFVPATGGQKKVDTKFFAATIAPIFQNRCLECHSGPKARNGLDLTTRAGALAGGESGPAVVLGDAGKSLLVKMVSGPKAKMPQKGEALSLAEVAALRQWIDDGA